MRYTGAETHIVEFAIDDNARTLWECSCGAGGSHPDDGNSDVAIEKHLALGDHCVYRYRTLADWNA